MKNKKGFTLIELLAVIVILGILLSISIVAVNKLRKKQNVENKLNVLSSIFTGAKNYIADNQSFWDSAESTNSILGDGRWISLDKIIKYADFDINKHPELYYDNGKNDSSGIRSAFVRTCPTNNLKYEVIYTYKEKDSGAGVYTDYHFSDCGCEEQQESDHSFKFCDANNPGAGWDSNGKYYKMDGTLDSNKNINFEK